MSKLSDELYDSLKDHIILKCGDGNRPESNIYDCWAPVEIKSILEDAHVSNSVYIHPIERNDAVSADMWCCVTWDSAGSLMTFGFNYMSEKQMDDFATFEKTAEVL